MNGFVDWLDRELIIYIYMWEEFRNVYLLMTWVWCPEVTLCGWQDIKIQLVLLLPSLLSPEDRQTNAGTRSVGWSLCTVPHLRPHTPSIAFRHLPPWRKDVVNQCLECLEFGGFRIHSRDSKRETETTTDSFKEQKNAISVLRKQTVFPGDFSQAPLGDFGGI